MQNYMKNNTSVISDQTPGKCHIKNTTNVSCLYYGSITFGL